MADIVTSKFPEGTPLCFIDSWKQATANQQTIQEIFANSGNYFTLHTGNISHIFNTLHIYLGADLVQDRMLMYAVPGLCDYTTHLNSELTRYETYRNLPKGSSLLSTRINSKLENIGLYQEDIQEKFNGNYTPEEQILIDSIVAWNTPKIRNAWLSTLYDNGQNIPLVIDIDISDFLIAEAHTCYLALKQVGVNYQLDLVIQSVSTGQFLNLEKDPSGTMTLRDMARPVPPFGQDVYTESPDQFGIYGLI